MRSSASRLRWVLLAGVFLLAAVVAGFFGLARYRAGKVWQRILARNGVNLVRESNGITWSQSSKGRTIFTLHASKAVPQGANRWALHDAVLILYGREKGRDDRIYGSEFEYDQGSGVARAMGEVHMDLQTPEPGGKAPVAGSRPDLGFTHDDAAATDPKVIHVRTSGLVYMQKLGVAATGEMTEFRYGGITCLSHGAEFDSEHSLVRLLADVKVTGEVKNKAFTLQAGHAELDRLADTADLTSPVLSSADRGARAAHALLHLRKDGTLEAADARGAVELHAGTQTVSAPQMTASFGKENHPEQAKMSGGVRMADTNAAQLAQGSADALDLKWDEGGLLSGVTAQGAVRYASTGVAGRQLRAERMEAGFAGVDAKHSALQRMHLTGGAELESNAAAAQGHGPQQTVIAADEMWSQFSPGERKKPEIQSLRGSGHTRLDQLAADGARQHSDGDTLEVSFAPVLHATGVEHPEVTQAVQTGHVELQQTAAPKAGRAGTPPVTRGHAAKAVYSAMAGTLQLTGGEGTPAKVEQADDEMAAAVVVLHQGTGDAEANGNVVVTSVRAKSDVGTHVLASRARLLHSEGISVFEGEPMKPAQLWQEGSQVQAQTITMDGKTHTLAARPSAGEKVQAVFATGAAAGQKAKASEKPEKTAGVLGRAGGAGVTAETLPEAERNALLVSADRLDYDDVHREAVFAGEVALTGLAGEVLAEKGVAFLKPVAKEAGQATETAGLTPELGGALDRFAMQGDVRLHQPGRTGSGEQLLYTAATGSFALTGSASRPPRITGENGTVVTGATLLFRSADSTIVVAGAKGDAKSAGPARVHTELDLKQ